MLIAISGSQGAGKSTVLKELATRGYNIIARKSARSILKDWGITLDEVNDDHELTIKFQDEITKRKLEDEKPAIESKGIWFTERTHADLFAYALVDLGRDNEYSEWVDNYYKKCLYYNQLYTRVYYLQAGFFNIEHDGTRGANKHYSRMVDLIMSDLTQQMVHPSKFTRIITPSLDDRVDIIDSHISMEFDEGVREMVLNPLP